MLFGVNVDPVWGDVDQPLRLTLLADRAGLDLVTVQDHPYQKAFQDTWTLMSFLAAWSERVTFVPTVANLPLRPPAMLAKAAASFDVLSKGRLRLGLGPARSGRRSKRWAAHVEARRRPSTLWGRQSMSSGRCGAG
ncbi:alkanesulfonate monooxygenase SsuD/methylene tetrahydromethanopterin reductase-like flavin-dependent oxidoreductase (luciferase family) [Streptomyces griseochromogenes]|uniref:Alkanesulfonate monooxygenase SsuD/methylene tetrahydromethanopterin reductase-like flavin-dependent oxidoreductase (Luciferase family) n=1 Tax=Streptomyces griseochromogenes TaxID=68214 RepID=A0ABS4M7F9_9ACTN|nr:LLM class flavin-dependent oxidoreductase [Streptomyces griseochromogenes]MBP2055612.1 alkanesulfonate monooxygenase SsuD/methylene tetrahydromethanopterin reductase-like flavin-dependent oxidoreductase (luciferase family) [Streptomyces griseochromogenes]